MISVEPMFRQDVKAPAGPEKLMYVKRKTRVKGAELSLRTGGTWVKRRLSGNDKSALRTLTTRRRWLLYGVLVVAICSSVGFLPFVCQPALGQQVETNPYADDSAAIEEAGKMYRDICSHCHGMQGEGGIGGSLNDSRWVKASTDKAVYSLIARGRKNTQMTPYEALGEDTIWKLVGFMRKLLDEGA